MRYSLLLTQMIFDSMVLVRVRRFYMVGLVLVYFGSFLHFYDALLCVVCFLLLFFAWLISCCVDYLCEYSMFFYDMWAFQRWFGICLVLFLSAFRHNDAAHSFLCSFLCSAFNSFLCRCHWSRFNCCFGLFIFAFWCSATMCGFLFISLRCVIMLV